MKSFDFQVVQCVWSTKWAQNGHRILDDHMVKLVFEGELAQISLVLWGFALRQVNPSILGC